MINIFNKIKFFFQRGIRGFSEQDLWDFEFYVCNIISGGLKELSKYKVVPDLPQIISAALEDLM